jgi:exosortase C (VPDSG-CTERM-specific)
MGSIALVTLAFVQPLVALFAHVLQSDLHSYIVLVPFVTAFLLYIRRPRLSASYGSALAETIVMTSAGLMAVSAALGWRSDLSVNDHLALMALGYVCFVAAGGFLFLGRRWMSTAAFPMAFLIFLVPLPDRVVYWLETASVLGSADVSAFLFDVTGTPLMRDGTVFALPGIVIQVAQECSGIRSSWVLFITSLIASHMFLTSPWRRAVLVAFVIPLAIVRNGFRILTIGLLCVHIGPHMIDSVIHHRGGPLFFALSLVPLFSLLWWLRRQERR